MGAAARMINACGHREPSSRSPRAAGLGTAPLPLAVARADSAPGERRDSPRRRAGSAGALSVIRIGRLHWRALRRPGRGTGKPGTRQCTQLLRWIKPNWYRGTTLRVPVMPNSC